jgi:LPS sulfotransferase NodH
VTPFVVYTSPRSGSSWLVDLLDSSSRIAAYAELFLPGDRTTPDYGSRDVERFESTLEPGRPSGGRLLAPRRIAYLRRLYAARPGIDAIGFKLMYEHPRAHPGLFPYLAARRVRVVHLVRANTLDQLLSWETASAGGVFRAHAGDGIAPVQVRLEAATVVQRLEMMQEAVTRAETTLARCRARVFTLAYESLRDDPDVVGFIARTFLGVDASGWEPHSTLVPTTTAPRDEVIENVGEVRAALAGSRFAWMLDSGS